MCAYSNNTTIFENKTKCWSERDSVNRLTWAAVATVFDLLAKICWWSIWFEEHWNFFSFQTSHRIYDGVFYVFSKYTNFFKNIFILRKFPVVTTAICSSTAVMSMVYTQYETDIISYYIINTKSRFSSAVFSQI